MHKTSKESWRAALNDRTCSWKGLWTENANFWLSFAIYSEKGFHDRCKHQPISLIFCTKNIPVIIQGTAKPSGEKEKSGKLFFEIFYPSGTKISLRKELGLFFSSFLNFQNFDIFLIFGCGRKVMKFHSDSCTIVTLTVY